jgi:hypothetical protein
MSSVDPQVRIGNIQNRLESMQPALTRQGSAYDTYHGAHSPTRPAATVPADLLQALEPGKTTLPADVQWVLEALEDLADDLNAAEITAIERRLQSMKPAIATQGSTYSTYETWAEYPSSNPTAWIPPEFMDALASGKHSFPADIEYALTNLEALSASLPPAPTS